MLQPRDAANAGLSSQGKEIVGLAVAAVLLAGTVVALRFYTRGVWLRVLGIEDWSIGLALVSRVLRTASSPLALAELTHCCETALLYRQHRGHVHA